MAVGVFDTFAFTMGVVTFFAPCAFPLLPGYVSYYVGRGDERPDGGTVERRLQSVLPGHAGTVARLARAALVGVVVSAGFFVVYGLLAGIVVVFGSQLLANISVVELVVGGVMIALGLAMLAGVDLSVGHVLLPERSRSVSGFFAFGVLYATAAAGCTAGLFASVVVSALAESAVAGLATMAAYALGMSVLMVSVTVSAALGRDVLVRRVAARTDRIQQVAGVLLVLAGIYQIYLFLFEFGGRELLGI